MILDGKPQIVDDFSKASIEVGWLESACGQAALASKPGDPDLPPVSEREFFLQHLLDCAPIGIVSVDSTGRITSFNCEAEGIFGYKATEICGQSLSRLIPTEQAPAHDGLVKNFIQGARLSAPMSNWRAVNGVSKEGRQIPLQIVIAKSEVNGEPLATAIIRDMTEIAVRDEQLADLAALNAKSVEIVNAARRVRRDFMAIMSHELRTPLNAIIGFSDLLLSDHAANLPGATKADYIADINTSGKQLLALINGVLDLTRIESGRMDLVIESVDVFEVLSDAVSCKAKEASQKGVSLSLRDFQMSLTIKVDREAVRQALSHVLSNAIKFSQPGSIVQLSCEESNQFVRLSVADKGIGIPKHHLPRLCRPFAQVEGPLVRANGGAGLGLATAKALVDAMRGRLEIESEEGVGTTVLIWLERGDLAPTASTRFLGAECVPGGTVQHAEIPDVEA